MKGVILYRILTLLLNAGCTILGMSLILGLMMMLANPSAAFGFFIALAVVLYAWHANKFLLKVIIRKEPTTKKHKDWLQVNAIVAFIFALICINSAIIIIRNPNVLADAMKQLSAVYAPKIFVNMAIGMLVFASILLVHISWTYLLIRKNKEFFIEEEK